MATSKKTTASKTRTAPAAKKSAGRKVPAKKWLPHVNETSDAMDLKPDAFKSDSPEDIAKSLKSSAEHSDRRKTEPFRSAMSMLNFYINRAGHNLKPSQHRTLEKAKDVLRGLFGRTDEAPAKKAASRKVAARKVGVKHVAAKKVAARKVAGKTATSG